MNLLKLVFSQISKDGVMDINEFLSNGLIFTILLMFLIPGYAYGKTVGKINNSNDLVESMTDAMKSMGGYLVLAFLNLFIGSASAKWAIMAPIFVPMMMRLHLCPELTQAALELVIHQQIL